MLNLDTRLLAYMVDSIEGKTGVRTPWIALLTTFGTYGRTNQKFVAISWFGITKVVTTCMEG